MSERVGPGGPADASIEVDIAPTYLARFGVYVAAAVLVIGAVERAQELLGLVVIAAVLASVVAPLVGRPARLIGRVGATVLIHLSLLIIVVAVTALLVQQIRTEAGALEAFADAQLEGAEQAGGLSPSNRVRLAQQLSGAVSDWGTVAVVGEGSAAGIAARTSQFVITIVLSIFFSLQSRELLDIAMRATRDRDRRRRLRELWHSSVGVGCAYLRRSLLIGAIVGPATATTALAFGLPGALLIGFWAALVSVVPLLGTPAAWAPVIILAALNLAPVATLAIAAIAVVVITAIALLRSRYLVPFEAGGFIATIGIAVGLSAAGIAGAVAGLFLAVAVAYAFSRDWSVEVDTDAFDGCVTSGALPAEEAPALHVASASATAESTRVAAQTADATRGPPSQVQAHLSDRTLRRLAGLVVLAVMIQLSITRVGPTLIWAIVGVLLAIALDRPVSWVERRWQISRSAIVILGAILAAVTVAGLLSTARVGLDRSGHIDDDIPEFVASLEALPLVGDRLAEQDLGRRVDDLRRELPRLIDRSPIAERSVGVAAGGVTAVFWIFATALTALVDGPRLVNASSRRMPARFTRQATRLARVSRDAIASYVAGSTFVAAINGALVAVMAVLLGVPIPAVLALWAFTWNFVPQIGAVIGWVPLLALAFTQGLLPGTVCTAFFVLYQALENNVIQPTIVGHAVNISALAALGVALLGAAIAGLVGAVLAIPFAGVVHALRTEWSREDFPSSRPKT